MNLEEIREQTKSWLDSRLRNPYFGAVITVWIITNRVLVFSIFNFDDSYSLSDKIQFVKNELGLFNVWILKGFWGTVVWSFFWGYFAMIGLDLLNSAGKALYKLVNRVSNYLMKKVEPSKWKEIEMFYELEQKVSELEDDNSKRKTEIKRVQKDLDDTLGLLSQSEKEKVEKEKLIEVNIKTIKLFEEQAEILSQERKKFKINYARYGADEFFIEVTRVVSDLLASNGRLLVGNNVFKTDPVRYAIKELVVEYQIGGEQKVLKVNEGELIEFHADDLKVTETEESKRLKKWRENTEKLSEILAGDWQFISTENGLKNMQIISVNKFGAFIINGELSLIYLCMILTQIVYRSIK